MTIPAASRDDRAAIDKAISVLASFGDDARSGVGVSELARRTDLSKSTTHRVLALLERNGMVERAGTDYRLGDRLQQLGGTVYERGHEELRDRLIPFLTDLFVATQDTVHLASLSGTDVVYLAKLYGHHRMTSPSRIGRRIPAHCTAVGKALLAFDPNATQRTLDGPLRQFTDRTIVDAGALTAELGSIRATGIAVENGEVQAGLSCIAVPVMGPDGRPVAALSVSGPTGRLDLRERSVTLRRIASAAARSLPAASTSARAAAHGRHPALAH